jgi:hypothetical protein
MNANVKHIVNFDRNKTSIEVYDMLGWNLLLPQYMSPYIFGKKLILPKAFQQKRQGITRPIRLNIKIY